MNAIFYMTKSNNQTIINISIISCDWAFIIIIGYYYYSISAIWTFLSLETGVLSSTERLPDLVCRLMWLVTFKWNQIVPSSGGSNAVFICMNYILLVAG